MNKKLMLALGIFIMVLVVVFLVRNNTPTTESYKGSSVNINENTIQLNNPQDTISRDDEIEDDEIEDDDDDIVDTTTQTNLNTQTSGISQSELAKHNSKEDCWVVYKDKVYDVTSYIPRHPGGEQRIAQNCGTLDFEDRFTKQHGTSKVSLLMKVGTFIGDFDVVGNLQ